MACLPYALPVDSALARPRPRARPNAVPANSFCRLRFFVVLVERYRCQTIPTASPALFASSLSVCRRVCPPRARPHTDMRIASRQHTEQKNRPSLPKAWS